MIDTIIVLIGVSAGVLYIVHTVKENRSITKRNKELTELINKQ